MSNVIPTYSKIICSFYSYLLYLKNLLCQRNMSKLLVPSIAWCYKIVYGHLPRWYISWKMQNNIESCQVLFGKALKAQLLGLFDYELCQIRFCREMIQGWFHEMVLWNKIWDCERKKVTSSDSLPTQYHFILKF